MGEKKIGLVDTTIGPRHPPFAIYPLLFAIQANEIFILGLAKLRILSCWRNFLLMVIPLKYAVRSLQSNFKGIQGS